jgi:hypothetical protein
VKQCMILTGIGSLNAIQFPNVGAVSASSPTGAMALEAFEKTFPRPMTATVPDKDRKDLATDRAMSLHSRSPTAASFDFGDRPSSGDALPTTPTSSLPLPPLLGPNSRIRASSVANMAAAAPPPAPQRSYTSATPESFERRTPPRPSYTTGAPTPLALQARHTNAPSPSPPLPSAAFSSAMPMDDDRDRESSNPSSRPHSRASNRSRPHYQLHQQQMEPPRRTLTISSNDKAMFIAVSLYEFKLPELRREAGFPYLNYVQGEVFDVSSPSLLSQH